MPNPALSGPGVYGVSSDDIVQDYFSAPSASALPTLETGVVSGLRVATGRFREFMDVELVNDGPVTFVIRKAGR